MKKLLLTCLIAQLSGGAIAQVYQIPNSDFSNWAKDEEPGNGWYSFSSAGGTMVGLGAGSAPKPSKDTDCDGDAGSYSCKIFSKVIFNQKANGNLTTGKINMGAMTASSTSNYNYTQRTGKNSLLFAGRPDAVEFYAKFTSGGSPNGRGNFILHGDVDYRDPEISSQASYKVGMASVLIPPSTEWVRYEGAFTYSQEQPATQYMLASITTNPTAGGSDNDHLWIDKVRMIYYHALSSLSYEGASLAFDENTLSYDLSNVVYDANKLSYTVKGAGATAETAFNESSKQLTITVKGDDYEVDKSSMTTYTIQFYQPTYKLSEITANGATLPLEEGRYYYTVIGERNENSISWVAEDGDAVEVTESYDPVSRISTITVVGGESPYYVKFAKEAQSYVGKMLIGMDGGAISASDESVSITPVKDGKVDFQLLNFSLEGFGLIGDIFVTDVPYATNGDGTVTLHKQQNIQIFGDMGVLISMMSGGTLAVTLDGELDAQGELTAKITLDWFDGEANHPIVVKVYPYTTNAVDAGDMAGASYFASTIMDGKLTNPNCLIYFAEGESVDGTPKNVVIGTTAASLEISEDHSLNVIKAFTATEVKFNRTFSTEADYVSSFVLPFAMAQEDVDGEVFELVGIDGDVLKFKTPEGDLAANTPYLIKATTAMPFGRVSNAAVETTPEEMVKVAGHVKHIGTYEQQQVTSDATTSYYGYSNGAFHKANAGTLNPFRTMIAMEDASVTAYAMSLNGMVTGIAAVGQELGKADVYDVNGRLVRSKVNAATSLQGLPSGIYIVNGQKIVK